MLTKLDSSLKNASLDPSRHNLVYLVWLLSKQDIVWRRTTVISYMFSANRDDKKYRLNKTQ